MILLIRFNYHVLFYKKGSVPKNEENHIKDAHISKQLVEKEKSKKIKAKEHRHSEKAVRILKEWLMKNVKKPYLTSNDKAKLALLTELTPTQVQNWFLGTRKTQWFARYRDYILQSEIENN